jgi:mono/diheme cytochrome c family protein
VSRLNPRQVIPILVFGLIALSGCDYARMKDQESIRTYKKEMPAMDERTIPIEGGYQMLTNVDTTALRNPFTVTPRTIEQGRQAYGYFCIHCHGAYGDGNGTVGQSFSPLPTDLKSEKVQSQTDGELYVKTRLGFNRHPRLYTTVSEKDTWAVVNYVRTLRRGGIAGDE